MKIIQINASYKPAYIYGGPTMSVSKLCEELTRAGCSLEVLTTTANGEAELDVKVGSQNLVDGVLVTYFRRFTKGNSHFSPSLILALWNRLSDQNSPVIVHVHAWWNMVSVLSCVITLLRLRPVLLSPRGTLSGYSFGNRKSFLKNLFHRSLGRFLLQRCHFHVSTEKEKQDIFNLLTPKTITVVPNFVELPSLQSEEARQLPQSQVPLPFKLISLSRIEEKKGLDNLFRALNKITIPYRLTIAGTGEADYIDSLKSLAAELRIDNNISWIGQQNKDGKFAVLADHDLMVLPSHDESFANVVIESLAVGTPVLISSMVGLSEYVTRNQFGWVCSNSPTTISDTITDAYHNDQKRKSIRQIAPRKVREDFNSQHLLEQYIAMYNRIAGYRTNSSAQQDTVISKTV